MSRKFIGLAVFALLAVCTISFEIGISVELHDGRVERVVASSEREIVAAGTVRCETVELWRK